MTDDVNGWLMGSGIPSVKFERVGEVFKGVIRETKLTQQTNYDSGEPEFWPNGEAKMQLVLTIAADDDSWVQEGPTDDGTRRLYVKGPSLPNALRDAIRAAGCDGVQPGAHLTVTFTGEKPNANRRFKPTKLFSMVYEPPKAGVGSSKWDITGDAEAPF